jgi:hypothetical protein
MGKIRNRLYWEWVQIRGNAKWQAVWSFLEPYWKEWVLPYWKLLLWAVVSVIGTAIAYFWEWVTGLHPLVIFFIFFGIYVLGWALVALVVFIVRGRKQPSVEALPVLSPFPTSEQSSTQNAVKKGRAVLTPDELIHPPSSVPTQRILSPAVRDAIRWDLKPHFTRGFDLLTFYKSPENRDEEAWQEWVQEVTVFLRNRLSESYVDRWNSRDGIDPPSSLSIEIPGRNRKIYADVSYRIERLAEFDKELKG